MISTAHSNKVCESSGIGLRRACMIAAFAAMWTCSSTELAAQDGCGWQPGIGQPGFDYPVYALTTYNGDIIAGGAFYNAGYGDKKTEYRHIARYNDATGTWESLGAGMNSTVRALAVYNGELIAGGWFTNAGGQATNRIARWNGTSWQPLGSGLNNTVWALAVYNGELIAAGDFTSAGGQPANRIARWNGSLWQPLGSGLGIGVRSLTVYNGDLIAGLQSSWPSHTVRRWNGSTWQDVGSGFTTTAFALTEFEGDLVAGTHPQWPHTSIRRWNGSGWQSLGNEVMDEGVYAFATVNGKLVAGGSHWGEHYDGRGRVVVWNGIFWKQVASWLECATLSWPRAATLAPAGEHIVVGGDFACAFPQSMWMNNIARLPKSALDCGLDSAQFITGSLFVVGASEWSLGSGWGSDSAKDEAEVGVHFASISGETDSGLVRSSATFMFSIENHPDGAIVHASGLATAIADDEGECDECLWWCDQCYVQCFKDCGDNPDWWCGQETCEQCCTGDCGGPTCGCEFWSCNFDWFSTINVFTPKPLLLHLPKRYQYTLTGSTPDIVVAPIDGPFTDRIIGPGTYEVSIYFGVTIETPIESMSSEIGWTLTLVDAEFTPGDLNNDGVVDGADLLILLSQWGKCADPGDCPADLNNDGVVDGADLLALLSNWG